MKKPVMISVNATVYTSAMSDANERLAHELRRIADLVEEGDTLGESGNMFTIADRGEWFLTDPWEDNAEAGRIEARDSAKCVVETKKELT
jgi:hypothetical protein